MSDTSEKNNVILVVTEIREQIDIKSKKESEIISYDIILDCVNCALKQKLKHK